MKRTRSAVCLIAFASIASCATPDLGETPETIGDVVRGMGYTAVYRPLEFWEPGAIVGFRKTAQFDIDLVCPTIAAMGANFIPSTSSTLSSSWRRATDRNLSVGVDVRALNAKLGYAAIRNVTMQLSNPVVAEISDTEFFSALSSPDASQACKSAFTANFEDRRKMTMIRSALKADVSYHITYEQGIDASLKYAHTQMIAADLAAKAKASGEDKVSGTQLIFGIIESEFYLKKWAQATPGLPQLAASGADIPKDKRLIPADVVINGTDGEDE